ncbi:MAG: HAMP domain-containing histidine kinase [Deltaproteobacteria bacterium]|nr:HAMP domain-containing histidine kinase [Deltaproteobacteria bacterium]
MANDTTGGTTVATHFASPERSSPDAIRGQVAQLTQHPVADAVLRAVGGAAVLLNANRQIISANARYLEALGIDRAEQILGMRPGESLDCVHAWDHPAGCGTGPSCASCGAAIAMVAAQQGGSAEERDCVVTCGKDDSLRDIDLRVRASPLRIGGEEYLLFLLQDVSVEKRREALERAFFHDVADLAAGLNLAAVQLEPTNPDEVRAVAGDIRLLASRLARELLIQRSLAESRPGAGEPMLEPIDLQALLDSLRALGVNHPAAAGKEVLVTSSLRELESDRMLLERILGCMVVNALEASPRGSQVRLEVTVRDGEVCFEVWNPGAIPEAATARIFQRYFSTKSGPGRGQGTFLMKLFGERWLGGKVGFQTGAEGTTFWLRLPARVRAGPEPGLPLAH